MADQTLYERIGEENILELVHDFYEGVESDDLIRKMYPEDLVPAKNRLKLFFIQSLGGRQTILTSVANQCFAGDIFNGKLVKMKLHTGYNTCTMR
ncbi:MAG: truncated hemoglobin YjbI [Nonlabens sp.]|jgi:truncated hemoglobin YjbI